MDNIDIYIYSSIKGNSRKDGKFIYILETLTGKGPATLTGKPKKVTEVTGYQSELLALGEALKRIKKPCGIKVHASNMTLLTVLQNGWYKKWAETGYKNSKGEDVSYADEWRLFNDQLGGSSITDAVADKHTYSSWMESECLKSQ